MKVLFRGVHLMLTALPVLLLLAESMEDAAGATVREQIYVLSRSSPDPEYSLMLSDVLPVVLLLTVSVSVV